MVKNQGKENARKTKVSETMACFRSKDKATVNLIPHLRKTMCRLWTQNAITLLSLKKT